MGEGALADAALPASLDARAAHVLREALAQADGHVVLEGEAVEFIGGAAFQTLLAARKTCLASDRTFAVRNASPAFLDQWRAMGGPEDVFETSTGAA
ncbi:MAG: STAS domain-containing protein [Alphaproteobacteria bacterium]|nr:STAS domain-containing protein [Alphaproteobacteria bacterium]